MVVRACLAFGVGFLLVSAARALEPVPPRDLLNQAMSTSGNDLTVSWDPTTTDVLGGTETVAGYRVYRGTNPDFIADKTSGSNRVGSPTNPTYTDAGAAGSSTDYFYLVSAVDASGNEGNTRPSKVTTGPAGFTANWAGTAASFYWTRALPAPQVVGYRLLWGTSENAYTHSMVLGNMNTALVTGLQACTQYFFTLAATDNEQNVSTFAALSGTTRCGPADPDPLPPPVTMFCETETWTGTRTLTLAESPYLVTCDILLAGTTAVPQRLVIEPGVEVRFAKDRYIIVGERPPEPPPQGFQPRLGVLDARGTPTQHVVFRAQESFRGYWGGIQFLDGTVDAESYLQYADVLHSGSPEDPAIPDYWTWFGGASVFVDSASPTVSLTNVRESGGDGFVGYDTATQFSSLLVSGVNGVGIHLPWGTNTVVSNNSISNAADWGLIVEYPEPNTHVEGNSISNCGGGLKLNLGDASVVVQGNNIVSISSVGIEAYMTEATIQDNTVDGGIVISGLPATGQAVITSNSVAPSPGTGILFQTALQDLASLVAGNTSRNTDNLTRLGVLGAALTDDTTVGDLGFPYLFKPGAFRVAGTMSDPAVLSITAGARFLFPDNTQLYIGGDGGKGALAVLGTGAAPVTFSGANLGGSGWAGIQFVDNAVDSLSILDHAVIEGVGAFAGDAVIELRSASPTIRNSTIRNALSRGIYANVSSAPRVENCVFEGTVSWSYASVLSTGASLVGNTFNGSVALADGGQHELRGNTFANFNDAAHPLQLGAATAKDLGSNTFQGVGTNSRIEMFAGTLSSSATWSTGGVPIVIVGDVTVAGTPDVTATLTLPAGSQLRFGAYRLQIGTATNRGALRALGTSASPVLLTSASASPSPGQWNGVRFEDASSDGLGLLEFTTIEYATQAVALVGASPTFRNVTLRSSSGYGIQGLVSGTSHVSPVLQDCTFGSNGTADVSIAAPSDATIQGSVFQGRVEFNSGTGRQVVTNNTFNNYGAASVYLKVSAASVASLAGNTFSGATSSSRLEVAGGIVSTSAVWPLFPFRYVIQDTIRVQSSSGVTPTLSLPAGAVLRFKSGGGLKVGGGAATIPGRLQAIGTSSEPILFSAEGSTTAGAWSGVILQAGSVDSEMRYVTVEYAGGSVDNAGVLINDSSPTIAHCTVRNSAKHGIRVAGSASPVISDSTVGPNTWSGIELGGTGESVSIETNLIQSNGRHGIEIVGNPDGAARFNTLTGNAQYGISATVSIKAKVQHNTLTGNSSGGISNTAATNLDARMNWFGSASGPSGSGPGTGQSVTSGVVFDPWLEGSPSASFFASDLFVSTRAFRPGSFTRFNGTLSAPGSWTVTILDGGGNTLKVLSGSNPNPASLTFSDTWDGTNLSNVPVGDGAYRFRLTGMGQSGSPTLTPSVGVVQTDSTLSTATTSTPTYMASSSESSAVSIVGSTGGPGFQSYALEYGLGLFPSTYYNIPVADPQAVVTDAQLGVWDTTGKTNGIYAIRVVSTNTSAEQTITNLGLIVLYGGSVSISEPFFSPNDDGRKDLVSATTSFSVPVDWSMEVIRFSSGLPVRTYTGHGRLVSQSWDGRLQDGSTVAAEDWYQMRVTGTSGGVSSVNTSTSTRLDVTVPVAQISDPLESAQVIRDVDIWGAAADTNFQDYALEYGVGVSPASYLPIDPLKTTPPPGNGNLGKWETNPDPLDDGIHTIRLTVRDKAGNESVAARQVYVVNGFLRGVTTSAHVINTSRGEAATVSFDLERAADVTFRVFKLVGPVSTYAGTPVRTMSQALPVGTHSFVWDGRDDAGLFVNDDGYLFSIEAQDSQGGVDPYRPANYPNPALSQGSTELVHFRNPFGNEIHEHDFACSPACRVLMNVTPTGCSLADIQLPCTEQPPFELPSEVWADNELRHTEWDWRLPDGTIYYGPSFAEQPGPVPSRGSVYFTYTMVGDIPFDDAGQYPYFITRGQKARVSRLKAAPYRLMMSYGGVSQLSFTLEERDTGLLTLSVLPPGVVDPADSSRVVLLDGVSISGVATCDGTGMQQLCRESASNRFVAFLDPIDPASSNLLRFKNGGMHTFAIQVFNPDRPNDPAATEMRRGVVNMWP